MLQLIGPVPLQAPCVIAAELKVTPAGSVSATLTFVACPGPLFVTTILYVRAAPVAAGFGDAVFVSDRSALVELTTRRETMAVCWRLPLMAVMVTGKVPTGVFALVVRESVEDFGAASVMLTVEGLKLVLTPVGKPPTLKATCPVNPADGASVRL